MEDRVIFFIYSRVVHMKREEDVFLYKVRVGLVGGTFDDEGQQAEAGVAIPEVGAGLKISGVAAAQELQNVRVENLGCLGLGDEGFVIFDAGGVGKEVADENVLADGCG